MHTPSPLESIAAPCPHYHAHRVQAENGTTPLDPTRVGCGGCKWQQVSYPAQLELKNALLDDSFRGISDALASAHRPDILPSPLQRGYRNKIEYSFGDFKSGEHHNTWAM